MTTYVLVHGAWHGGWCWSEVAQLLSANGALVHAPTLTGLGERAHLASHDTSLETHIADVLGVIEAGDIRDVVLVGHSYAGIVVTAAADRAASRIARLVYLDALVPKSGQGLYDRVSASARAHFEEQARIAGDGWLVPVTVATPQFLGLTTEEQVRSVIPRLTPHPIRTFREMVDLKGRYPHELRTYINCIGDKPAGQPRGLQAEGIDDYHELRTGHDAMVTAPREVAKILRRCI